MKRFYKLTADMIFLFHLLLVLTVLFGWLLPSIWSIYMVVLIATLVSDMVFGYCILSKWEFDLRKHNNQKVDYDFAWATYYTYKLTNQRIRHRFFKWSTAIFLTLSLAINLYFEFV